MVTVYQFFLYLPLYISRLVGYMDLQYNLQRAADKWGFDFQLAVGSGDGYGDPRELGVLKAVRDTQEEGETLLALVIECIPGYTKEITPAEALAFIQAWGAPDAYFDDGQIIKPSPEE